MSSSQYTPRITPRGDAGGDDDPLRRDLDAITFIGVDIADKSFIATHRQLDDGAVSADGLVGYLDRYARPDGQELLQIVGGRGQYRVLVLIGVEMDPPRCIQGGLVLLGRLADKSSRRVVSVVRAHHLLSELIGVLLAGLDNLVLRPVGEHAVCQRESFARNWISIRLPRPVNDIAVLRQAAFAGGDFVKDRFSALNRLRIHHRLLPRVEQGDHILGRQHGDAEILAAGLRAEADAKRPRIAVARDLQRHAAELLRALGNPESAAKMGLRPVVEHVRIEGVAAFEGHVHDPPSLGAGRVDVIPSDRRLRPQTALQDIEGGHAPGIHLAVRPWRPRRT